MSRREIPNLTLEEAVSIKTLRAMGVPIKEVSRLTGRSGRTIARKGSQRERIPWDTIEDAHLRAMMQEGVLTVREMATALKRGYWATRRRITQLGIGAKYNAGRKRAR